MTSSPDIFFSVRGVDFVNTGTWNIKSGGYRLYRVGSEANLYPIFFFTQLMIFFKKRFEIRNWKNGGFIVPKPKRKKKEIFSIQLIFSILFAFGVWRLVTTENGR